MVCTLHEGDDFGKLALINDAPRAATIITNEDNCHFLRVDKADFNRILRDVEANTIRLQEHGRDVLILQRFTTTATSGSSSRSPSALGNRTESAEQSTMKNDPYLPNQLNASTNNTNNNNNTVKAINKNSNTSNPLSKNFFGRLDRSTQSKLSNENITTGSPTKKTPQTLNIQDAKRKSLADPCNVTGDGRYAAIAGTREKMLDYLLQTRVDYTHTLSTAHSGNTLALSGSDSGMEMASLKCDPLIEDFLLTYPLFCNSAEICAQLLKQYPFTPLR